MGTTNDVLRVLHRIEKALERIEKKLDEVIKENRTLKTELKAHTEAVSTTKTQLEELQEVKKDLESKLSVLQKELNRVKEQNSKLAEEKRTLEEQNSELNAEISTLKSQLDEKERMIKKLGKEIAAFKETAEVTYKEEVEGLRKELEEYKSKLDAITIEKDKLEKERNKLERDLEGIKLERDELKEKVDEVKDIIMKFEELKKQTVIQEVLLKKNVQYHSYSLLSKKIAQGQEKISAKELGYKRGDISLAAWLENYYGDLQKEGLVQFEIKAGGGFPEGWIIVTEKGKRLFKEAERAVFK